MHVTQKKLADTMISVRWVTRKLGHMGLLAALPLGHVNRLFAWYVDKGSQILLNKAPILDLQPYGEGL